MLHWEGARVNRPHRKWLTWLALQALSEGRNPRNVSSWSDDSVWARGSDGGNLPVGKNSIASPSQGWLFIRNECFCFPLGHLSSVSVSSLWALDGPKPLRAVCMLFPHRLTHLRGAADWRLLSPVHTPKATLRIAWPLGWTAWSWVLGTISDSHWPFPHLLKFSPSQEAALKARAEAFTTLFFPHSRGAYAAPAISSSLLDALLGLALLPGLAWEWFRLASVKAGMELELSNLSGSTAITSPLPP